MGELDQPSIFDIMTKKVTPCPYMTITKTMTNELNEKQKELYNIVDKNINSPEMVSQLAIQSAGKKKNSKKKKIIQKKKITKKNSSVQICT